MAVSQDSVSTVDLMLWAIQFARGMDFLASQNVKTILLQYAADFGK